MAADFLEDNHSQKGPLDLYINVDVLEGNHSLKDLSIRKPLRLFHFYIDVDTSEAFNPGIKITRSGNIKYEKLNKQYKKRGDIRNFFIIGRVFALLWYEIVDVASQAGSLAAAAGNAAEMTRFGERVYTHMQRMIVVREIFGYCICIPIMTYVNINTYSKNIPMTSNNKMLGDESLQV
jgi:hypothetical protein